MVVERATSLGLDYIDLTTLYDMTEARCCNVLLCVSDHSLKFCPICYVNVTEACTNAKVSLKRILLISGKSVKSLTCFLRLDKDINHLHST